MKELIKIGINLMLLCTIAGVVLAVSNYITEPAIKAQEQQKKLNARKLLLPEASTFIEKGNICIGKHNDKEIGYIVTAEGKGYGGSIWIMVGIDTNYKITDFTILKSHETPGLGDKIKDTWFKSQFVGKTANQIELHKEPTKEYIQAITGATISSKAITCAMKAALEESCKE